MGIISKALAGFRGSRSAAPKSTVGAEVEDGIVFVDGHPSTTERSAKLQGKRRWRTYQDLVTNTLIVAASVRYFLNLIAGAEWTVKPPVDEDGEPLDGAQEVADFIEECRKDMETSWSRIVRRAAMFKFNGFSIQEWTAKQREDGRLGMKDVEARPCSTIERWDLDEGGSVQGVTQRIWGSSEVYLPRGKIVYLVDDALEVNPEGQGLYRHLVRSAERLRAYEELEELAFETDLRGIPIGRAPLKEMREAVEKGLMTMEGVKKARQAVDNFVKNKLLNKSKGAVLDSETYTALTSDGGTTPSATRKFDVELLKGESKGQTEAASAINRINREMAVLLGTEHLLLGADGTGSLALGWTKLSSFFLVVSSTLGEIAEAFNRDWVQVICRLNGIPKELWPELKPQDIDVSDIEAVAQVLSSLATAGATLAPDDPAVDVIRGRAGLPPAPPPPELSEEDQALVDRMRAGLPLPPEPGPEDEGGEVKPGSEGAQAERTLKKLLGALLGPTSLKSKGSRDKD